MNEETFDRNRKMALRFLKEIGLLNAWKEYTNGSEYRKNTWHKKVHIDSIFGDANFTGFLSNRYGIRLKAPISNMFRYYLVSLNLIGINELEYPEYIEHAKKGIFINKKTREVNLII